MTAAIDRFYRVLAKPLQDRWLGGVHAGLVVKGLYLQWMVARFLRQGHRRVLDAGCGPEAQLAAMLAGRYPACSFVGWDLHITSQARGESQRPNLTMVEADLGRLDDVEMYDLVYSIDVLEHIHDYADVLNRIVRALRPGGLLFIHVPNTEQRTWFKATEAEAINDFREHRAGDDHVREGFDKAMLMLELERRSVSVVEARWTFNGVTAWLKEVYSLGERRRVRGIGLLLLPAVVLAVMGEMVMTPRRGNGLCVLGVKKGLGAQ